MPQLKSDYESFWTTIPTWRIACRGFQLPLSRYHAGVSGAVWGIDRCEAVRKMKKPRRFFIGVGQWFMNTKKIYTFASLIKSKIMKIFFNLKTNRLRHAPPPFLFCMTLTPNLKECNPFHRRRNGSCTMADGMIANKAPLNINKMKNDRTDDN